MNPTNQRLIPDENEQNRRIRSSVIVVLAISLSITNLAFAIPDLIFAYQGSDCVQVIPQGFSFNLSTWLIVDGILRSVLVGLMLTLGIFLCACPQIGIRFGVCVLCFVTLYSVFSLSWTMVGSVMFWGKLNPAGLCQGPVQHYLYATLIISYIGIACSCLQSRNNQEQQN